MEAAATNLERRMEDVVESTEIAERVMKEAAEEAEVKAAVAKATVFLLLLVRVRTDQCKMF